MSRIDATFATLKKRGQKALIPFITAGDPSLAKTKAYVKALVDGGADIIELGMPFSDPMADGPVIQEADERALKHGTNLTGILRLVSELRRQVSVPIVLMGYYNPVYRYGIKKFSRDAQRAGVDGCLLADLPLEESDEVLGAFNARDIDFIYLLAPTSNVKRVKGIAKKASGYLYYVSMTGITGAQLNQLKGVQQKVRTIRRYAKQPLAVGFGISKPAQARAVAKFADGVVVGSAFVKQIGKGVPPKEIKRMAASFKKAMN